MIRLVYRLRGISALRHRLIRMADKGKERAALEDIGRAVHRLTMKRFETETDPWGRAWAPLAPSTVARRRQGSRRILQDTGTLKRSFAWEVRGHAVAVGTFGVPGLRRDKYPHYAVFHQFGTERMPARKMLPEEPWPEAYLKAVTKVVKHYYGVRR